MTTRAPPCPRLGIGRQHQVDGGMGLVERHGDDDALAGGQAVGLDHDRRALGLHMGMGRGSVREGGVGGGGDAVAHHEGLGKGLGAFQLGGGLGGAEDAQAVGAELVHHPCRQRAFGAYDREADLFLLGPGPQFGDIGQRQIVQAVGAGGAAIARSHMHHLDLGRLRQLPGQGVFTATAANDENLHSAALW